MNCWNKYPHAQSRRQKFSVLVKTGYIFFIVRVEMNTTCRNSRSLSLVNQPRSQGLFPGLGAGREKTLASAGHVPTLHPEILGVIN